MRNHTGLLKGAVNGVVLFLASGAGAAESTLPKLPEPSAKIALYADKGTWSPGVQHFHEFLQVHGYEYDLLSAEDILNGRLTAAAYSTLIMPGGQSWEYLRLLGKQGGATIKKFVEDGGGYFGICAGGFYATSRREGPYPTKEGQKPRAETAVYDYGIGLIEGVAVDGANISQLKSEFRNGMRPIEMLDRTPDGRDAVAGRIHALMLEGSGWRIEDSVMQKQKVEVLARFPQSHLPAVIAFEAGKGRVVLSGPHLEIEEQNYFMGIPFKDPESDWPIIDASLQYVRRGATEKGADFRTRLAHMTREGLKPRVAARRRFTLSLGLFR
jgi:biotin--protein ligase